MLELIITLLLFNPFLPTVPTFAVRETDVSRTANVVTVGKNGLRCIVVMGVWRGGGNGKLGRSVAEEVRK